MASKKFGLTRKENPKAKTFQHSKVVNRERTKEQARIKFPDATVTDSRLTSGSINYNLTLGNNLISFPFQSSNRAYAGNGEPQADPKAGWWYPWEIDDLFDNKVYQFIGEGEASIKIDKRPGTSGSTENVGLGGDATLQTNDNWIGSLTKIWPHRAYWVKVTGSSTVNKTITKQLIDPATKTSFIANQVSFRAYPFSEYSDVSPNGLVPAGNDHNIIADDLREGVMFNQIQGASEASVLSSSAGGLQNTWLGNFTFKTGSGFMVFCKPGYPGFTNLFNNYASTGSDSGESNNDDSSSDSFYTSSIDVCYGSSSDYVHTNISNGNFVYGQGGGTFQTDQQPNMWTAYIPSAFSGSYGVVSSSILNHDFTQLYDWNTAPSLDNQASGSDIEIGVFNLSGSNAANYGTAAAKSGSVEDNEICFGNAVYPTHTNWPIYYSRDYIIFKCQIGTNFVSGSISGSNPSGLSYPQSGSSNMTSSIRVYSPLCDRVYNARLYRYTASSADGNWIGLDDLQGAQDVTHTFTGSANDIKWLPNHFIRLRNDEI